MHLGARWPHCLRGGAGSQGGQRRAVDFAGGGGRSNKNKTKGPRRAACAALCSLTITRLQSAPRRNEERLRTQTGDNTLCFVRTRTMIRLCRTSVARSAALAADVARLRRTEGRQRERQGERNRYTRPPPARAHAPNSAGKHSQNTFPGLLAQGEPAHPLHPRLSSATPTSSPNRTLHTQRNRAPAPTHASLLSCPGQTWCLTLAPALDASA